MLCLFLLFFQFFLFFWMNQSEKYQLNLQINLSPFPFLVSRVLKQNKPKSMLLCQKGLSGIPFPYSFSLSFKTQMCMAI